MLTLDQILPKWTKRVVTETGGRDPLGLSRVSQQITDFLLTGIITTTDRARYYSFYCWALWHIEKENPLLEYEDFISEFRRREAFLAIATIANNSDSSPVGVEATQIQFEKGKFSGFLDCDFKVLPSNRLGGFKQYYAGSMHNLGLTSQPEENLIYRVTPGKGEELAKAFHSTIEQTPYIEDELFKEREISIEDLDESKKFLTLDALTETFAKEEKEKLIGLFFNLSGDYFGEKTLLRKHTLTLLLYLIAEYNRNEYLPTARDIKTLDEYLLYPMYYGSLWCEEEIILPASLPENFRFCQSLWRQFCLHQFFAQALELLLYSVIETVGAEPSGLGLEDTIEYILQPEFYSVLSESTESVAINSPFELFKALGIEDIPSAQTSAQLQRKWLPDSVLSEAQILSKSNTDPSTAAARSMLLLALVYGKWRGVSDDSGMNYLTPRVRQELWSKRLFSDLDTWFNPETTWQNALSNLSSIYILQQHDRIMYEKRRLDSCWLRQTDGKIFKEQDFQPVWRASRFLNSVRIMTDLGLVEMNDEKNLEITEQGENLLKELLMQEE